MNQIVVKLKSNIMRTKVPVCILLPDAPNGADAEEFYTSGKKYPVLWLLHGATGDYDDWMQNCRLDKNLRGHELIVVMPNGINSDFANHMEFGTGYAYTDFFFKELMPFVYGMLPASRDAKDNYITGFSMGGAAAIMLGLLKPEKFAAIAPLGSTIRESAFLKPYMDMTGTEFRAMASENPKSLPTEWGRPEDGITLKEINMIARYPTVRDYVNSMECTIERFPEVLAAGKLPEMFFCCGSEDLARDKVMRFLEYVKTLDTDKVSFEVIAGANHDQPEPTLMRMIEHFGL